MTVRKTLAILVVLLLRCLGERLAPQWRFLLWGVVLTRLLVVATPVSPWSVFNLVRWNPEASARPIAQREAEAFDCNIADLNVRRDRNLVAINNYAHRQPVDHRRALSQLLGQAHVAHLARDAVSAVSDDIGAAMTAAIDRRPRRIADVANLAAVRRKRRRDDQR